MKNFSLLVQDRYKNLSERQKTIFKDEYNRRKKPLGDESNSDLALEILRDLSLFENNNKDEIKNNPKDDVNTPILPPNNDNRKNYSFFIITLFILLFVALSAFTKPSQLNVGNKIVDKLLENQPELIVTFKNFFFGKEMKAEFVNNFIINSLSKKGFNELEIKEHDLLIIRIIKIKNTKTKEDLITAYGIWGQTFVKSNFNEVDNNTFLSEQKSNDEVFKSDPTNYKFRTLYSSNEKNNTLRKSVDNQLNDLEKYTEKELKNGSINFEFYKTSDGILKKRTINNEDSYLSEVETWYRIIKKNNKIVYISKSPDLWGGIGDGHSSQDFYFDDNGNLLGALKKEDFFLEENNCAKYIRFRAIYKNYNEPKLHKEEKLFNEKGNIINTNSIECAQSKGFINEVIKSIDKISFRNLDSFMRQENIKTL